METPERTTAAKRLPGEAAGREAPSSGRLYSREELRSIDRLASERYLIPTLLLMENAASWVAREARGMLERDGAVGYAGASVLIICGGGNNGGDGLAAARHLASGARRVSILLCADPGGVQGDVRTNLEIARRMELPIGVWEEGAVQRSCDRAMSKLPGRAVLVIDALFGTGLNRPVTGAAAEVIRWINGLRIGATRDSVGATRVLAVDLPSGLDADTGKPLGGGPAVVADRTVTFVGLKRGFGEPESAKYTGEVVVADIGIPEALVKNPGG